MLQPPTLAAFVIFGVVVRKYPWIIALIALVGIYKAIDTYRAHRSGDTQADKVDSIALQVSPVRSKFPEVVPDVAVSDIVSVRGAAPTIQVSEIQFIMCRVIIPFFLSQNLHSASPLNEMPRRLRLPSDYISAQESGRAPPDSSEVFAAVI